MMSESPTQTSPTQQAWRRAWEQAWQLAVAGKPGDETACAVRGAVNDYSARGKGTTMARRVFRSGAWAWVSAPASRGRYLASDRRDVKYGYVYEGEIVAEYTLGEGSEPDAWYVVTRNEKPLQKLAARKVRDGYYVLTALTKDGTLLPGEVRVSSPYWR